MSANMPRRGPTPDEAPVVEAARRSLEEAGAALRQLRALQQEAERLVRQASDLLRQLDADAASGPGTAPGPLLSVAEVSEILGISRTQAGRMVREGAIPGFRLGHRWVVSKASLEGWEEGLNVQGLG